MNSILLPPGPPCEADCVCMESVGSEMCRFRRDRRNDMGFPTTMSVGPNPVGSVFVNP